MTISENGGSVSNKTTTNQKLTSSVICVPREGGPNKLLGSITSLEDDKTLGAR